jgi:hypothetical protein
MTVINGIEIDDIKYIPNRVAKSIQENTPVEDTLHVIIVVSNPCQYARRYILAREFIKRFEENETKNGATLYIVELAYGKQQYHITEKNNRKHLRLHTNTAPLWHKENMINIGVKKLLPPSWKAFAWIDADVEFDNVHWAQDTLKLLNGSYDIVQLFSHAVDMDATESAMSIFSGFGFQYAHGQKYGRGGVNFFHPGFAWAITRDAYEQLGGLYELSILGSGDNNMALSFIGHGLKTLNHKTSDGYKESVQNFCDKAHGMAIGYVPGVIRHYFHGSKKNRKYAERWLILINYMYDPFVHVKRNADGLLVPTEECPQGLLDDILTYFAERDEDEGYLEALRPE